MRARTSSTTAVSLPPMPARWVSYPRSRSGFTETRPARLGSEELAHCNVQPPSGMPHNGLTDSRRAGERSEPECPRSGGAAGHRKTSKAGARQRAGRAPTMIVNRPTGSASATRVAEPREGALVIAGESLSQALSDVPWSLPDLLTQWPMGTPVIHRRACRIASIMKVRSASVRPAPAMWPQIDGIGRKSTLAMNGRSYSASVTGKYISVAPGIYRTRA